MLIEGMDRWPLHLLVVALPDGEVPSGVLDQLRASRATGAIHLIDGGILSKGNDGELTLRPAPELELDPIPNAAELVARLFACGQGEQSDTWTVDAARIAAGKPHLFGLSADDLAEIADEIPRASGALALVIAHRWNAGFAESAAVDRCTVLAQGSIVPQTVLDLIAKPQSSFETTPNTTFEP
jgi:hypothetical protein